MIQIALYQPEIPPNTGNIMRLCANAGARLHLIKPLGFSLDEKKLRRAGLDYREFADVQLHEDYSAFLEAVGSARIFAISSKVSTCYTQAQFQPDDVLLFGPETRGLPSDLRDSFPTERRLRIPMAAGSRSLNLSNAAAILLYEALRQTGFQALS